MKILLLDKTEKPEQKIAYCARICYSKRNIEDIKNTMSEKEIKKMVNKIIKSGHHSVLEHITFTFGIQCISRNASHQLVRHRLSSYSQQSLRYTEIDNIDGLYSMTNINEIPNYIKQSDELMEIYTSELEKMQNQSISSYKKLTDANIKPEDARNVLLTSINSNMIITMNGRSIFNFLKLRLCKKAQLEINNIAWSIFNILNDKHPTIFNLGTCGAPCQSEGKCKEINPC